MSENNAQPKAPEIEPLSDESLEEIAGGFCSVVGCSNANQA